MTGTSLAERFFIDAMSPRFREDPYPHYDGYRGDDPLLRADETVWLCLSHAEVTALTRHPKLSSNEARATTEQGQPERDESLSLLFMDPPDHTRLRALVSRAFTPKRTADLRPAITAIVAELLEPIAGRTVDLVQAFAYPLPVRVICALLGVPAGDQAMFTEWSRMLARSLDPSVLGSAELDAAIAEARRGMRGYLGELLAFRTEHPADDLLSALLAVRDAGDRISRDEVLELALLLLVAGHETTVNLIGNGVLALLRHPDQLDLLCRRPDLVPNAVDELLRFDAPVQMAQRIATEDLDLAGRRVRAGDEIMLVLGAANRDPAAFAEPGRLDVTRDARRHVSFGGGIHYCLGASLARLEAGLAFSALLGTFELELAGAPAWRPTFTLRGLAALPVRSTRCAR
ncbi:cytochrome P450 [Pseudonocardia acaciae]|uniref:cytochrome P450 n=1 Tax=Pseudonocardia acaciae TaxID=551276 RepID=UPI00048FA386|nr:cytochrome P450 [Pseudonocardia acaciae]